MIALRKADRVRATLLARLMNLFKRKPKAKPWPAEVRRMVMRSVERVK